jgi:hypothetical protein
VEEYLRARDEQPRLAALIDELRLNVLIAKRRAARSECAHLTMRITSIRELSRIRKGMGERVKAIDAMLVEPTPNPMKTNPEPEGDQHA